MSGISSSDKTEILFKKFQGYANTDNDIITEFQENARPYVPNDRIYSQTIPSTAPSLSAAQNISVPYKKFPTDTQTTLTYKKYTGIGFPYIVKYEDVQLYGFENQGHRAFYYKDVSGNPNLLKNTIPSNYDSSVSNSYKVILKTNGNAVISPDNYSFDIDAGLITFYGNYAGPSSTAVNQSLPPKITFWRYEGVIGTFDKFATKVSIGQNAGATNQGESTVAIGQTAGSNFQGSGAVAIGFGAGRTSQNSNSVAIGRDAGSNLQQSNAIAIGLNAGSTSQGSQSVAIGQSAGNNRQGIFSVAIGDAAGQTSQGAYSVAIGDNAGSNSQASNAIAIGLNAGVMSQKSQAIAIGNSAGSNNQGIFSIAIGDSAGSNNQGNYSVALGDNAGQISQSSNSVAIGLNAGSNTQGIATIAIGQTAGSTSQGLRAIAIGVQAGMTSQGSNAIAIGQGAGETSQAPNSIAINAQTDKALNPTTSGFYVAPIRNDTATSNTPLYYNSLKEIVAGPNWSQITATSTVNMNSNRITNLLTPSSNSDAATMGYVDGKFTGPTVIIGGDAGVIPGASSGVNRIAIGSNAGSNFQGGKAIAVGFQAGQTSQGIHALAMCQDAGVTSQGSYSIAIGNNAGNISQGVNAISIGRLAGSNRQSQSAIAIGQNAGLSIQNSYAIAIGENSGKTSQGSNSIAIGLNAAEIGRTNSNLSAIAIGVEAGRSNQGQDTIAVGTWTGCNFQSSGAVAIGMAAGRTSQQSNSIAIGRDAGSNAQGQNAIAIGQLAGQISQSANTIVLNATGSVLNGNGGSSRTYIAPIRNDTSTSNTPLYYTSANELVQGPNWSQITATSSVNMNNNTITGLAIPGISTDAATKGYVDGVVVTSGIGSWATYAATSTVNMNNNTITSLQAPTAGTDATTKDYVDGSFNTLIINATSIKIGSNAGSNTQTLGAIAIGSNSGRISQQSNSIAIGINAGNISQGGIQIIKGNAVAIGNSAGSNTQGTASVAIGINAGNTSQSSNAIAIGQAAGSNRQGAFSVAIGDSAGSNSQGQYSVAIGDNAGQISQGSHTVSIGYDAGSNIQGSNAVAIGNSSGKISQQSNSIAIGRGAGSNNQGSNAIAIGNNAGSNNQSANSIVLNASSDALNGLSQGFYVNPIRDLSNITSNVALYYNTSSNEIVRGPNWSQITATSTVNMNSNKITSLAEPTTGTDAATKNYVDSSFNNLIINATSIKIGSNAGSNTQTAGAIAIGSNAGRISQQSNSIAIGINAGNISQGGELFIRGNAIAIGNSAGSNTQGFNAIAIGNSAGSNTQGFNSIAIGNNAGQSNQKSNAVAIGDNAGQSNQGQNAIAIGQHAGQNNQSSNSIVINASGATLNGSSQGFYVAPVRSNVSGGTYRGVYYDTASKELVWGDSIASENTLSSTSVGGTAFITNGVIPAQVSGYTAFIGSAGSPNAGRMIIGDGTGWNYSISKRINSITTDLVTIQDNGDITAYGNITAHGNITINNPDGSNSSYWKVFSGNNTGAGGIYPKEFVIYSYSDAIRRSFSIDICGNEIQLVPGSSNPQIKVGLSGRAYDNTYYLPFNDKSIIKIGSNAGATNQGTDSVAVGSGAGQTSQGLNAVAIGWGSGANNQKDFAISIGRAAGNISQGSYAVGIGWRAGFSSQGSNAIAIGKQAAESNQNANSIVLNAQETSLSTAYSGFYVAPIREFQGGVNSNGIPFATTDSTETELISYVRGTKEIVSNPGIVAGVGSNVNGFYGSLQIKAGGQNQGRITSSGSNTGDLFIQGSNSVKISSWSATKLMAEFDTLGANQIYLFDSTSTTPTLNIRGTSGTGRVFDTIYNMPVPVGTIVAYSGSNAPNGWLLCDGTTRNNNTYSALSGLIGNLFGAKTATDFFLPDLKDKFLRGKGNSTNIGEISGNDVATLTIQNMPAHSHETIEAGHAHPRRGFWTVPVGSREAVADGDSSDGWSIDWAVDANKYGLVTTDLKTDLTGGASSTAQKSSISRYKKGIPTSGAGANQGIEYYLDNTNVRVLDIPTTSLPSGDFTFRRWYDSAGNPVTAAQWSRLVPNTPPAAAPFSILPRFTTVNYIIKA